MFTDPLSVTYNAVATPLPRVDSGNRRALYESADDALRLTIAHTNGKRQRSELRLDHQKNVADPLNPSVYRPVNASLYLVANRPVVGYTDAEVQLIMDALLGFIGVSGNKTKFLGQES